MNDWVDAVRLALQIEGPFDLDLILDTAHDAADHVERQAAPVAAYLLGMAVAGGAEPHRAANVIRDMALGWRRD